MIDILSDEAKSNPIETYALMREKYPVCEVEPGGIWALTRYKDVEYALKNDHQFSAQAIKGLLGPDWLSESCKRDLFVSAEDPPIHTQKSALINKTFIPQAINYLEPLMREKAVELTENLLKKEDCDFVEDFAFPYINLIINTIVGIEEGQDVHSVRKWIETIEKLTLTRPSDAAVKNMEARICEQMQLLNSIIVDRRLNPRDDLVTKIVHTKSEHFEFTDDMIINILDLFIRAGYMTTVHSLGNLLLILSRRPDLVNHLKANIEDIPNFIEEVLRLHPPAVSTLRVTTKPVEMHGVTIPENSQVLLFMAAANRDPRVFANPDEMDLHRVNAKEHISFGTGAHVCLGLALARLELKVAMETILSSVESIQCPDESKIVWMYAAIIEGIKKLPLKIH